MLPRKISCESGLEKLGQNPSCQKSAVLSVLLGLVPALPPLPQTSVMIFCVFFHREHFWMPCPCFSWGIFCSHRVFVRMHSRGSQHHHRHNQALQEPLCCGSCPWIPHLSENISFLLLPVLLSLPAFLAICSTLQRWCEFSGPPVNLLLQFVPLFKPMWIPRWSRKP